MAVTHFHPTTTSDIEGQGGIGRPVMAGFATVLLVAALVFAAQALFAGQHGTDFIQAGAVLGLGAGALLVAVSLYRSADERAADALQAGRLPPAGGARRVRRHRRFVPKVTTTLLTTANGHSIAARIVDVSIGGVSVEARISDLEFANVTRVGSRAAGPVRRTSTGAVFTFETLLDPVIINDDLVL